MRAGRGGGLPITRGIGGLANRRSRAMVPRFLTRKLSSADGGDRRIFGALPMRCTGFAEFFSPSPVVNGSGTRALGEIQKVRYSRSVVPPKE